MEQVTADAALFRRLKARLPAATREQIMATYGVSETTWCKLRDGKPVKRATLERILARLDRLAALPPPASRQLAEGPRLAEAAR